MDFTVYASPNGTRLGGEENAHNDGKTEGQRNVKISTHVFGPVDDR